MSASSFPEMRNGREPGECLKMDNLSNYTNTSLLCDCESVMALNASEFEYVGENTVSFNGHSLEVQFNTSQGLPVICADEFLRDEHVRHEILSYVLDSLSILCCCLLLLTFFLFKELRTLSAKIVVNISVTVALSGATRIVSFGGAFKFSEFCEAVGILNHFTLLAQFSWMTIMSFQLCNSFYLAGRMIPVSEQNEKHKLLAYHIVGWTIPLIIVVISVVVNYTTLTLVQYGPLVNWDDRFCLLNHALSMVIALWLPLIISILVQAILFFVSLYFLFKASARKNSGIKRNIPYFRIVVAMFFATDMVWVLSSIGVAVGYSWSWYPFIVVVSFQSPILFFGFYGTRKVLKLYVTKVSKLYNS